MNINYNRYNINPIIDKVRDTVKTHELGEPGKYARWIRQNAAGSRNLGVNAYGCADAANILYTIGDFPSTEADRSGWIKNLQALQTPETGEFHEGTHFVLHTTAHCIAALELFDRKPLYELKFLIPYREKENLYKLLDELSWVKSPWNNSHIGAGIFVALVLSGEVDAEWKKWYFDWLYEQADPETGLWRKGCVRTPESAPIAHNMAGSFHYLFNHESEKMPLRYPKKMIDTCLDMFYAGKDVVTGCENLGNAINFMEVDWLFCLNRAFRQCGYKAQQVKQATAEFAKRYYDYLSSIDEKAHDSFNDLHMLFGAVCALAETAQSVYGIYEVKHPLRLVLDRRPFI